MKYSIGFLLLASLGLAAEPLAVDGPWVRLMPPGVNMTAAYMTLRNQGDSPLTIEAVRSPEASSVMLHGYRQDGDKVRMTHLDSLTLAPHQTQVLEPGALHLMVMGLSAPLAVDKPLTLTLYFSDGRTQDILARPRSSQ
ncbi:copper chaperone PCu(A)C [Gallaecimonas xiamenensis]|uniref:Copper chaperone PCu(A)C n=1 Tax=Gallaecimonas xiamenensis 3-C-1 TaxID=745411 RepID=K2JTN3_9GAMM|nr:copper chaperone PCu(A)C [Gallaecimonas xiamenensis]EKE73729.1 hypothetical protein B3C1_10037 [Gallaecimonas xiamenensis 3-C-1]